MEIDRVLVSRGLELVGVGGINDIIVDKDCNVAHKNPDQTVYISGNLGFGSLSEEWVLPDIQLFVRIMKTFSSQFISVKKTRNCFDIVGDDVHWRYRLGNSEFFKVVEGSKVAKLSEQFKVSCEMSVDILKKVESINAVIKAEYISFISSKGTFRVVVGDETTYSGTVGLNYGFEDDFQIKVASDTLIEIIGKIDLPSVLIGFAYKDTKMLRIALGEFKWMVGAV